mmetsp:Transcript_12257/g.29618  ORF Transcript_12257/g.29618 Transcript_12257/m.29618 type:complete len:330 (+) Transcript_12257:228-1217(+)|eukprot:CAMPEP_0197592084 /NCGR_PEP_ID=MMETSP1326-20131121/14590_1 /TAXON_ID=1155430 /ORGANISM="Genus nov. species nov., Strain RCC2288" /LENGTH=329 /DNA_ID=CAMNT_0043157717 /DNA_START=215 /DNA_END=1204 /DNA_ORIENTATION=-
MPKRSTQTYSSEDAPANDEAKIIVYYCKYCGEHVLITDAVLGQLPKRKTDNARVLDTEKYTVRLKAEPEVKAKLIKRANGKMEKQYRYICGELPVCYKSEQEGKYLYLIDGALSAFNFGQTAGEGGETPVPPCIQQTAAGTVQVAMELEDKVMRRSITKITADEVGVAVQNKANHAQEEIVEFFGKILHLRLPQMSLLRGWSTRSKLLMVQGLTAAQVYERIKGAMDENKQRIQRMITTHTDSNKHMNRPELEKLERIDPELAKQEIHAHDAMEPYDAFRVKGGAAQFFDPYAPEENGPTNVYMGKDQNAGMNWNDAGPHKLDATTGHF